MAGEIESLEAARKALEQLDYPTAIAHLKAVCQTQHIASALSTIEANTDKCDLQLAIAISQILINSTNPQVKEWAIHTCAEFDIHSADRGIKSVGVPPTTPELERVAGGIIPPAISRFKTTNPLNTDLTGFIAFDTQKSEDKEGRGDKQTRGQTDKRTNRQEDKQTRGQTDKGKELCINLPPSPPHPLTPSSSSPRSQPKPDLRLGNSRVNLIPFWLLQCGSAIALFWLVRELLNFIMALTNDLLVRLPYLEPFQPFYHDQTNLILLLLLLLLSLSPWLLDAILRRFYGLQPLSMDTLTNYSPQASKLLQRTSKSRKRLPKLAILPTSAPIALTYGNLPRTARIVVSQGLIEQLADDEIATIYAAQAGHIAHWDFVVMSLFMVVTQIPYIFYWQVSNWGDKRTNEFLRVIAAVFANFAYLLWFVLSVPAFWLSQLRIYYSDRTSSVITGNPNGLVRAILKVATGVAQTIGQQGHTSWLLESWNLFTVVSYHQAITISSLHSYTEFSSGLAWDCLNPVRYWLNINNTHPLIGDRLQRLTRIAHHFCLEPELNLPSQKRAGGAGGEKPIQNLKSKIQNPPSPQPPAPSPFLLQISPYLGIFLGFALGGSIWLLGGIATLLKIPQLMWMWGDRGIIQGCLPIGLSIGIFMRINRFFPDIKPDTVQISPNLTDLLANSTALPINGQIIRLQGKLLGRRGISNWLGQDLILHLPTGLVKLHHISLLGMVSDRLLASSIHPTDLLGRYVFTTGWFRRGATAWIDIDTLRTQGGKVSRSCHPLMSTLLACAATAWGIYTILTSG